MKLVLGGDSHAQCILAGLKRIAPEGIEIAGRSFGNGVHTYTKFFHEEDGELHFTIPEYQTNWLHSTGAKTLRVQSNWTYLLSLGLYSGPLFYDAMWITCDPPGYDGHGEKITSGVLQAIIEGKTKHIRAFYRALKDRGAALLVAPAPPPYRKHWCLKTRPAAKVATLHKLYISEMESFFSAAGIAFLRAPAESMSADGFLEDRFRVGIPEEDPHHANAEYGELVAREALARILSPAPR